MLLRLADVPAHDPHRRGCLVVNAAMERIPADSELAERISDHLQSDVRAIAAALARARTNGELSRSADPQALARFLVTLVMGLRVVGKGTADTALLRDAVRTAMTALPRSKRSPRTPRDE